MTVEGTISKNHLRVCSRGMTLSKGDVLKKKKKKKKKEKNTLLDIQGSFRLFDAVAPCVFFFFKVKHLVVIFKVFCCDNSSMLLCISPREKKFFFFEKEKKKKEGKKKYLLRNLFRLRSSSPPIILPFISPLLSQIPPSLLLPLFHVSQTHGFAQKKKKCKCIPIVIRY